jgi:hypothetical protein
MWWDSRSPWYIEYYEDARLSEATHSQEFIRMCLHPLSNADGMLSSPMTQSSRAHPGTWQ